MAVFVPNAAAAAELTAATRLGSRTGSGRSRRASAKLNIAEVAPIPIASEHTATVVKPLFFRSMRAAYCKSLNMGAPPFASLVGIRSPAAQSSRRKIPVFTIGHLLFSGVTNQEALLALRELHYAFFFTSCLRTVRGHSNTFG